MLFLSYLMNVSNLLISVGVDSRGIPLNSFHDKALTNFLIAENNGTSNSVTRFYLT